MLSHKFTVKGKDYDCRLSAKACVELEKKLGTNPLNIFMEIAQKGQVPSVEVLITILQASLIQFNHGMSMDKTYELYDDFVDEGHNIMDLVPELLEIFKVSGLIPEADEVKNA
jgi:hypothetical protein